MIGIILHLSSDYFLIFKTLKKSGTAAVSFLIIHLKKIHLFFLSFDSNIAEVASGLLPPCQFFCRNCRKTNSNQSHTAALSYTLICCLIPGQSAGPCCSAESSSCRFEHRSDWLMQHFVLCFLVFLFVSGLLYIASLFAVHLTMMDICFFYILYTRSSLKKVQKNEVCGANKK